MGLTLRAVLDINLSRTVNATPEQVFNVWLDAKSPGGPWFGAERVILHPEVDGLFYHAVGRGHQEGWTYVLGRDSEALR